MTTRTTSTLAGVALAAGIFIGWAIPRTPATPPPPATQPAAAALPTEWPVVRVVDGDTAIIRWHQSGPADERLRLLNVDTPERGKPGFQDATVALRDLLAGGKVRLEFEEPGTVKRHNFGRLLVYVYADGRCVNVELVRLGWSAYVTKYGRGRLAAEFEAAEKEARAARRGMWRGADG